MNNQQHQAPQLAIQELSERFFNGGVSRYKNYQKDFSTAAPPSRE
jgi:hypothetical protein